jgi:hypothetical protein
LGLSFEDVHIITSFSSAPNNHDQHFAQIVNAFQDNSKISLITLCCGFGPKQYIPSTQTGQAMLKLLETNTTLSHINFFPRPTQEDWKFLPQMEFYLGLNRMGRKMVLTSTTNHRPQWIRVLARASKDVSALFYFLSVNPALCCCPEGKKRPVKLMATTMVVSGDGSDNNTDNRPRKRAKR